MAAMKLAKLPDRTPVKITFSASPGLSKLLALYAAFYRETYGQPEPVAELIPYALETFLEGDRGFAKFRREHGADVARSGNVRLPDVNQRRRTTSGESSSDTSGGG